MLLELSKKITLNVVGSFVLHIPAKTKKSFLKNCFRFYIKISRNVIYQIDTKFKSIVKNTFRKKERKCLLHKQ